MKRILMLVLTVQLFVPLWGANTIVDCRNRIAREVLTNSNISAIVKDVHGFIWLASRNELVRYDGNSYSSPGDDVNRKLFAGDNVVQQLCFHSPDILWICSNNGLFSYNVRLHELQQIEPLVGKRVSSMIPEGDNLYLNCSEGIILFCPLSDKISKLYSHTPPGEPAGQGPTSMSFDAGGHCWLSVDKYLLRLPSLGVLADSPKPVTADTIKRFSAHQRMLIDPFNTIWLWDRETLTTGVISSSGTIAGVSAKNQEISALHIQDSTIFLCNRGRGIVTMRRHVDGTLSPLRTLLTSQHYDDLSNTTNVFFADESGTIWLGTRDGLFMLPRNNREKFLNIRNDAFSERTLSHNTVSDIYIEGRNTAWIATAHGLNKIRFATSAGGEYTITRYYDNRSSVNYVLNNKIERIATDGGGVMWLGTKGNIKFYDPRSDTYLAKPAVERALKGCSFVRALCRDRDNDMWIGFEEGGLFRYDASAGSVEAVKTERGRSINCSTIAVSENGMIWAGSRSDGILRIEKSKSGEALSVRQYRINDPLTGKALTINCIRAGKHGDVWVGTNNGLYKYSYDADAFIAMPVDFADRGRYIAGIIEDNRGNLWLASLGGVYKCNFAESNFQYYQLYDDYLTRTGFVFGYSADSDGYIYMGGLNGLTLFNPNDIKADTLSYKVKFTDFKVHNKTLAVGSGILSEDINYADFVTLNHNDNQFSFAFSALSYTNGDNLQYSYKLEGIDDDWIYTGPEGRYISYGNLPRGLYKLKIRSTNSTGIWQDNVRTLTIRVKPALMARWYFCVLYVLLLGAVVWLAVRFWMLRMKLRSQAELESHKLKLYTEMSYRIKTPLTLMVSPLRKIIDHFSVMSEEEITYLMSVMQRNAGRLSLLVDQFVQFRKVSAGKSSLKLIEADIIPFVEGVYDSFGELFESKEISFAFSSGVERIAMVFDPEKMEAILFNLLSNIYKHTERGGRVELRCRFEAESGKLWIEISATDFKYENWEHVLRNEANRTEEAEIGLLLAREFIKLHHGRLQVDKSGVRFCLLAGSAHFDGVKPVQMEKAIVERMHLTDYIDSARLASPANEENYLPDAALVYMVDEDRQIPEFVDSVCRPSIRIKIFDDPEKLYETIGLEKPGMIISAVVFGGQKKGLQLCEKIKANPATNDIPFMFVSSYSADEDKRAGYECGADAYITKPFDVNHLKKRIMLLLQSQQIIREKAKRELIVNPKEIRAVSADDRFLARAMEIIESNISEESFTVDGFARKMNLSPSMLYRKLKSLTNLSPNEFIKSVRLKRAAQLLAAKAYSVSEIAFQVGFTDIRYFSTCFKKGYGVTPSAFRQGGKGGAGTSSEENDGGNF